MGIFGSNLFIQFRPIYHCFTLPRVVLQIDIFINVIEYINI